MSRPFLLLILGACGAPNAPFRPDGDTNASDDSSGDDSGPGDSADTTPDDDPMLRFKAGSRIKTRIIVGDDGSESFLGFWDSRYETPCAYVSDGTGTVRCMPTVFADAGDIFVGDTTLYADASCTKPLAQTPIDPYPCSTTTDPKVARATTGVCDGEWHEIGPRHTGPIYVDTGVDTGRGPCDEVERASYVDYWPMGAAIALTDFVKGSEEVR